MHLLGGVLVEAWRALALDDVEALHNAHPEDKRDVLRREALDGGKQLGRLFELLGNGGLDPPRCADVRADALKPLSEDTTVHRGG